MAPPTDITGAPRVGIADIGAYQFIAAPNPPPTITGSTPSVVGGSGTTATPFDELQLTLNEPLNPIDADAPAAFQLLGHQGSGAFGEPGDTVYTLVPEYTPGSTTLTLSIIVPGGGELPSGNYQFTVFGGVVHDLSGFELAGDGTTAGTNYVRTFSILEAWSGNGADNLWSTGANWLTSSAPNAGDDLVFQGSVQTATDNDLPTGTSLHSITLASPGFLLAGNGVTLASASATVVTLSAESGTIQLPITLGNDATFAVTNAQGSLTDSGDIDNGGHNLTFDTSSSQASTLSGSISGAGGFIKNGSGEVILSGSNSFSGGTQVLAGTLVINTANALPNGTSLTIGAGGTLIFDPSIDAGSSGVVVGMSSTTSVTVAVPGTTTQASSARYCCR